MLIDSPRWKRMRETPMRKKKKPSYRPKSPSYGDRLSIINSVSQLSVSKQASQESQSADAAVGADPSKRVVDGIAYL